MVRGICHFTGNEFYRKIQGRILKPGCFCKCGHVSVVLEHGTKGQPVHQLIMKTFVGEPPSNMEILHINGNPKDNRLSNLRYGTRSENIIDVYIQGNKWRKLSIDDVHAIRFGLFCKITQKELSQMYDVSISTISAIKRGKIFSWLK